MSVAVFKDSEIAFSKGFGFADLENEVPAGPETVYRIGSVTKPITAIAVLQLVEQRKVALDDDITEFLPDYPTNGKRVTVHNLLTHTSGIASYTDIQPRGNRDSWKFDQTHESMLDVFETAPYDFEPGTGFYYSNSGYYLLGMIIEHVSGQTYEDYVKQHVFDPAGMTNSCYDGHQKLIPHRASGYMLSENGEFVNADYLSMTIPFSSGALCSTAGDLMKLYEALSRGELLKPETFELMKSPIVLSSGEESNYTLGLMRSSLGGQLQMAHPGGIDGFTSFFAFYPEFDVAVAVLTNVMLDGVPDHVGRRVIQAELDLPIRPLEHQPLDDEALAAYTGTYRFGIMDATVTTSGDTVGFKFLPLIGEPVPLIHLERDVFCFPHDSDMTVTFTRAAGTVSALEFNAGVITFLADRVD